MPTPPFVDLKHFGQRYFRNSNRTICILTMQLVWIDNTYNIKAVTFTQKIKNGKITLKIKCCTFFFFIDDSKYNMSFIIVQGPYQVEEEGNCIKPDDLSNVSITMFCHNFPRFARWKSHENRMKSHENRSRKSSWTEQNLNHEVEHNIEKSK